MEGVVLNNIPLTLPPPEAFENHPNALLLAIRLNYKKKYPHSLNTMKNRHNVYNRTLDYIHQKEKEGSVFAIRPPEALNIKAVERDEANLERVYQIGRAKGKEVLSDLIAFLLS